MTRPSFQSRMSSLTSANTCWSLLLPGQHQHRTGMPSLVGQADDDLRQVRAVILGVPEPAEGVRAVLLLVAFEVCGGGVEEQQINLKIEQVGHGEEHRLLHPGMRVGVHQQVHRPVRLILVHHGQSRDDGVLTHPLGGRQLAHRRDRPVGDQREQHPLHVRGEPPRVGGRPHRRPHVQPVPQSIQQPGRPDRTRVDDLQRRRPHGQTSIHTRARARTLALTEVLVDRRGQPAQSLDVDLVDPAQVHQHIRLDPPVHAAVVGQGHVAHHAAVGVGPRREPQEHDYDSSTPAQSPQGLPNQVVLLHLTALGPDPPPPQARDQQQSGASCAQVPTNCGTRVGAEVVALHGHGRAMAEAPWTIAVTSDAE